MAERYESNPADVAKLVDIMISPRRVFEVRQIFAAAGEVMGLDTSDVSVTAAAELAGRRDELYALVHDARYERCSQLIKPTIDAILKIIDEKGLKYDLKLVSARLSSMDYMATLSIDNPRFEGKADFRHFIGKTHGLLGRVKITCRLLTASTIETAFEYQFVNTPKKQRARYSFERQTTKAETLLARMREELVVPSDEDLDRVMVAKRMQRATAEDFAARQRLSKATNASVNGVPLAIRALNLLLESNVEIPEDMKAAMAEFMDASDEAVRAAHQHALVRDEYMEKNAYVEG